MRAISNCHWANFGSRPRSQLNAARIAGREEIRAISRCKSAKVSEPSRGMGAMRYGPSYNGTHNVKIRGCK